MTAWSKRWRNLKITTWNCFSLSKERKSFCESLGYDILALTELRNKQQLFEHCKTWIPSATAPTYKAGSKQGQSADPAAGVAILLSSRMEQHYKDSGHVGARIAWVRLAGPIVNICFVAVYLPHKYRTGPCALDTLEELEELLLSHHVHRNDCIIVAGDLNCQLQLNVPGCTGLWSMTKRKEKVGHDMDVLDLMSRFDLFAIATKFKPKRRIWSGKLRRCNATYLPKHNNRRPTKLDYILVSNRWKSSVRQCCVKWGASMHRFGKKFDHGLLEAQWDWRLRVEKREPKPDYSEMTQEKWKEFDDALQKELIRKGGDMKVEISEDGLGDDFVTMSNYIQSVIKKSCPQRKELCLMGVKHLHKREHYMQKGFVISTPDKK